MVKSLARIFAFGAGAATALLIIGEAINIAFALSAKSLDDIDDDGWITLYPEV